MKFKDTCISGVVTSSEDEEEGKAQQEGLIIFAGFSGSQVENSVLFVPKGKAFQSFLRSPKYTSLHLLRQNIKLTINSDVLTLLCVIIIIMECTDNKKDFSTVLDVSSQIAGSAPTPSFAHVGLPIQNEAGFTEVSCLVQSLSLSLSLSSSFFCVF